MKNLKNHSFTARVIASVLVGVLLWNIVPAMGISSVCRADEATERYFFGETMNTGHDNGFSEGETLTSSDPHYGWELGRFCVEGFTEQTVDTDGNVVFLKNVGDTVVLSFELLEDIDELDGDDDLSISDDTNGYDEYFETDKTNCGLGMLIIRKKDSENSVGEARIYTDYLSGIEEGANTEVALFEEGDYEVALDYEIKESRHVIGPIPWFPEYHDYRIFFKFSVRNSNCMAYPVELNTYNELKNESVTENGFYLDLANSKYLDTYVQYDHVTMTEDGYITDTRYNRAAREGEQYTDAGLYTITVKNRYTMQTTVKTIRVGTIWNMPDSVPNALETATDKAFMEIISQVKSMRQEVRPLSDLQIKEEDNKVSITQSINLICRVIIAICLILILILDILPKKSNQA